MKHAVELKPKDLYRPCDGSEFDFKTTADLDDSNDVIGQGRAVEAVRFGVGIRADGYNIFALGPAGTGKESLIRQFFQTAAAGREAPFDWCYVNNFSQPHKPHAIRLPAGQGVEFVKAVDQLEDELEAALSTAFESEEYQNRRQEIQDEFQEEQEESFEGLRKKAEEQGFALLRTPAGLGFAPVREGEVVDPEAYQKIDEQQRTKLEAEVGKLQEELQKILRRIPRLQHEVQERMRDLNREMANLAVGGLIDDLRQRYRSEEKIVRYLNDFEEDVIEHVKDFLGTDQAQEGASALASQISAAVPDGPLGAPQLRRFRVNLLVDHSQSEASPVVDEDNPTYANLVGRVEHIPQMGALLTDFNLIKPGALHLANGGYLILDARKLLMQPYSWEGLKRALRSGQVQIESPGQAYGLLSTVSLEPEPIPLDVKVALVGDRELYYMLSSLDPDFDELFKVMADFETAMDRTEVNQKAYADVVARLVKSSGLRPFDRKAVGRVVEQASRMVEDNEKLSIRMRAIENLLKESDYWAGEQRHKVVTRKDVQQAIDAQIHRADRIHERMREAILRDTVFIQTTGEAVGQINGLSVIELGDFMFGQPSRITAQVRTGKGEVVDIEREVELGGPIHSKGVLILAGFLGARYGLKQNLSLAASLVFEQSYGGVDGDSASSTELYALMSAIGNIPIRQSLAVTGSVDQHGEIQPVGGVNEKIEGFFEVCRERGLTGDQGVMLPASNVKNLMLRQDVIDAVKSGKFHIYPVATVDEGMRLLSGLEAGKPDTEGNFPEDSFNGRIQARLAELAAQQKAAEAKDDSG